MKTGVLVRLLWVIVESRAVFADWVTTPGTQSLCSGDDAHLDWQYTASSQNVDMIFWIFLGSGKTMLTWYTENNSIKVYEEYVGRVGLLAGSNAGVVLSNTTKSDSGEYKIEVGGPGWRDTTTLNVYTASELKPVIQVDNEPLGWSKVLDKSALKRSPISVNTVRDLTADITIIVDDVPVVSCSQQTICSAVLIFDDFQNTNLTMTILVDYEICDPHKETLYIYTGGRDVGAGSSVTVALFVFLLVLTLAILAVLIALWFVFRKQHLERKPQTKCRQSYVKLPCFYRVFTKLPKWKSQNAGLDKAFPDCETRDTLVDVTTPKAGLVSGDWSGDLENGVGDSQATERLMGGPEPGTSEVSEQQPQNNSDNRISREALPDVIVVANGSEAHTKPEETFLDKFSAKATDLATRVKSVLTKKQDEPKESENQDNTNSDFDDISGKDIPGSIEEGGNTQTTQDTGTSPTNPEPRGLSLCEKDVSDRTQVVAPVQRTKEPPGGVEMRKKEAKAMAKKSIPKSVKDSDHQDVASAWDTSMNMPPDLMR